MWATSHALRRRRDGQRMSDDFRTRARLVPKGNRYEDFEPQVRELERAMRVRAEPTVPCNNDLLAENFIDVGGEMRLIDYEYSGNNEASFELGNVWSESNLSLDQLEDRIAIVRDNIRQLIEQSAADSGAANEARNADRLAQQQAELETLTKERDELQKKQQK